MKNKKIEQLLNSKAESPTPGLTPDPFLATRIEAIVESRQKENSGKTFLPNWSFASIITACALVLGVYVGSAILESDDTLYNDDIFSDYSQAFYQSGFADNIDSTIESEGSDQ